jgi:hypothetical protein
MSFPYDFCCSWSIHQGPHSPWIIIFDFDSHQSGWIQIFISLLVFYLVKYWKGACHSWPPLVLNNMSMWTYSWTRNQTGIISRLSLVQATTVQNLIKYRYVLCTFCSNDIMYMVLYLWFAINSSLLDLWFYFNLPISFDGLLRFLNRFEIERILSWYIGQVAMMCIDELGFNKPHCCHEFSESILFDVCSQWIIPTRT